MASDGSTPAVGVLRTDLGLGTNQRDNEWAKTVTEIMPNGMTQLAAISGMLKSTQITKGDASFNWTEQILPRRDAPGLAFTNGALTTAYATTYPTTGAVAGALLYWVPTNVTDLGHFIPGQTAMLQNSSNLLQGTMCEIVGIASGAGVQVRLLENDREVVNSTRCTWDTLLVVASAHEEHGDRPTSVNYAPVERFNYCQIFRTSLELSRRQIQLKDMRYGNEPYRQELTDKLRWHEIDQELTWLFGVRAVSTGPKGYRKTFTSGLIPWARAFAPATNIQAFNTSADYAGQTWAEGGWDWLKNVLNDMEMYGDIDRMILCGSGAFLAMNEIAEAMGHIVIQPGQTDWGLDISVIHTPNGRYSLSTHPLLNHFGTAYRHCMLFFRPADLEYYYIQDTMHKPDPTWDKGGGSGTDGKEEEFLTDAGLKVGNSWNLGFLTGVGLNNTLSGTGGMA